MGDKRGMDVGDVLGEDILNAFREPKGYGLTVSARKAAMPMATEEILLQRVSRLETIILAAMQALRAIEVEGRAIETAHAEAKHDQRMGAAGIEKRREIIKGIKV